MHFRSLAVSLVAAASLVAADFKVDVPSASNWWVAKSTNVLQWECKDPAAPQTFTVLVSNQNAAIFPQPLAIIAIQNNFDCSIIVTQDQSNQAAGTGYQILLANPLNNTDVYATSEAFEIKPLGSLYPSQQADAVSSASAAAASSASAVAAANPSTTAKSGALSTHMSSGLLGGMAATVVGIVGGVLALI